MDNASEQSDQHPFVRACRYLGPHRRSLIISVICALGVGLAFTGGIGTVLPIMQVLVNGDTVADWVNRKIAERRMGVRFVDDALVARLGKVKPAGPAALCGLRPGNTLQLPEDEPQSRPSRLLAALSDPRATASRVLADGQPVDVALGPVEWYLAKARDAASLVPVDPIAAIAWILGFLVFLALVGNVIRFFQQYLSEKAAILAVRDLRHRLYDHTLHLHLSFFGLKGASDVTSRLTQDAQNLQDGMKTLLGQCIQEPIKAGMVFALALAVSWELTLFIVLFAPVMAVLIRKFGKRVRRAARAALQSSSVLLGQVQTSLEGIRVVKASGAERFERRRFRGIADSLAREYLRIARLESFNTPMLELLTLVVVCVIVLFASYLVLRLKVVEPATFFLVMACLMGIGESLRRVSKINLVLQKSTAAAARLFEIIDLPVETPRRREGAGADGRPVRPRLVLPPMQRDIRFEGVTFAYPGADAPAVQDVDLTVMRGACVAIVGRNGSGKTTLLALLPRFFDPQRGRILIDGIDIRQVTLSSLRGQIGIVTQESVVFPGTIAENIAYGMPLATREQIIEAARRAFAHDFIMRKPDGYDTMLGGHGAQLSGGEKQRLCIARAILRAAPILILDEATSQVDAESEHLIQQAVESLMRERTTFVIAHRLSTIRSADTIVVMDRGRIVGRGSHAELLAGCPTYQQLYERQMVEIPA